jgi:hypothetical protein
MIFTTVYNGTFSSKNDLDDQNLLVATVHFYSKKSVHVLRANVNGDKTSGLSKSKLQLLGWLNH